MGSIEVPIDRKYPDAHPGNFPRKVFILPDVAGLKSEKMPQKSHSRVRIGRIGGAAHGSI